MTIYGRSDVKYVKCAQDEHGVIDDPHNILRVGEKLRLVPGHCDPTCNVHDLPLCYRQCAQWDRGMRVADLGPGQGLLRSARL